MQHRLVVVGSLVENIRLVKEAKERGYYTIVCDGYDFGTAKKMADKAYTIDVRDTDAVAEMCIKEHADGIIGSFSDLIFEKITEIASKANLKWYCTPEQLKYYRDKNEAKKLMEDIGIRVPKHIVIHSNDNTELLKDFCFPLVIKPVSGWGSRGIYVVHDIEELIRRKPDVLKYAKTDEIEVEEYSHGHEHNVLSWLVDGKVHIIGIANREKTQMEKDHIPCLSRIVYPANDYDQIYEETRETLQKFADATGQKSGPLCMQFFYNEHGVEVCEIAGRILAYEHVLAMEFSNIDVVKLLLDYVYDEEHIPVYLEQAVPNENVHCTGIYYLCNNGEKIKNMQSIYEIAKDPHIFHTEYFYKEGDTIDNDSYRSYFAYYYLKADSRKELDDISECIYQNATVKNDKDEEILYQFALEQY